ncbi:hypothetical protein [Piscinibacter koreensis]|uniref:Uncharacterized protein n=1 Tax=Piscinibacter koreensis TaxID=2742824 RepID=A0A7Y6NTM8_9BURK|nr:hypothetical protein [Schlegelella koreensis]NUZ09120.1 hypothetical protein [Schlegelella koreensis]
MWLIVAREPLPDKAYWPGRVWLAAADAVAWPTLWSLLALQAESAGLIGSVVVALSVMFGLKRLHQALWLNHRYRFTAWRWGKVVAGLMLIGIVLKLSIGN